MKTRRKVRPKIDGIDYLGLCRGQPCYLRIGPCADPETVVPCHSNQGVHGKAMGLKAKDIFTVPGCQKCHFAIDQGNKMTKAEKFAAWDRSYEKWSAYRETLLNNRSNS